MPLPLAMMIPFMGIQSAVMAKQFGENFQYGKRRISAMSNDEFNKLTPKMIQDNANAELKAMIPSMQDSITDMRQFQEFMIKEMVQTIGELLKSGLGFLIGVTDDKLEQAIQDIEHFLHGHFDLHTGQGGTTTTEPPIVTPPLPVTDQPEPSIVTKLNASIPFLLQNSQGQILFFKDGSAELQTKITSGWFTILKGTLPDMVQKAAASWPSLTYYTITRDDLTPKKRLFWILKSKFIT